MFSDSLKQRGLHTSAKSRMRPRFEAVRQLCTLLPANVLPAACPRSHTAREHGRASRDHRAPAWGRTFMDLRGAVALVTGGNGGLGQRICHALAREGAHIAVNVRSNIEEGKSGGG